MQMCEQRYRVKVGHVDFPSKSDPSKEPYRVYAFRSGEPPMCTCFPFLTARKKAAKANGIPTNEALGTCRHIKQVMAETCCWTEEDRLDGGYRYDGICPRCGGPLVDDTGHTADEREVVIGDLVALRAKFSAPPEREPEQGTVGGNADELAALLTQLSKESA